MNKSNVKIGLALSGGGAKGAYQIGVLKAFEEKGILEYVTDISGTSVGGLNAVIYFNGYNYCKYLWGFIDNSKILSDGWEILLKKQLKFIIGLINPLNRLNPLYPFKAVQEFYGDGFFSRRGLTFILKKISPRKCIEKSGRNYYISTCKKKSKLPEKTIYHEISTEDFNNEKIIDVLLASSAIPGVFAPIYIDGGEHCDGATLDLLEGGRRYNLPLEPLRKCDFKIGVDLKFNLENSMDCDLYISPSCNLLNGKTLKFDNSFYCQAIELGYNDALREIDINEMCKNLEYFDYI